MKVIFSSVHVKITTLSKALKHLNIISAASIVSDWQMGLALATSFYDQKWMKSMLQHYQTTDGK